MTGLIFSVKRYSIHDGPGIRVTFFMKGCPLECIWCHNPEGISPLREKVLRNNRVGGKTFHIEEEVGKYYTVDDILEILDKERIFISQSGGGVTFSGGEPMLQFDFLLEALKACKKAGYHTVVDTSGYSQAENYRAIMPFTNLFLFDLKHIDDKKHLGLTGVSNKLIIDNCLMLNREAANIMIRIPVIPGKNDDDMNLMAMKKFVGMMYKRNLLKINLLPYHKIGSTKYKRFKREWKMGGVEPPDKEEMSLLKEMFSETGVKVKIGG